jgi:HindVP restriction endonuclease
MIEQIKPALFGIQHSNRDFSDKDSWGKNQFNSSFPAALSAYLESKGFENNYLTLDTNFKISHQTIDTTSLFGLSPQSDNLFYAFESQYLPFQKFLIGNIPRVDLVTQDSRNGTSLKGLEIKLTALPDNSTCNLSEDKFGCEIVVRPDTIVYLACSLAVAFENEREKLLEIFSSNFDSINDWTQASDVIPQLEKMIEAVRRISLQIIEKQQPLVIQPIWKTQGKSPKLAENCLDVFVWSNLAFIRLFTNAAKNEIKDGRITRQLRTVVWLCKMLYDFAKTGQINHTKIIDELSFNTKNDKAFALSGRVTQPFMKCEYLLKPRITKSEIKEIILGNGQDLLSPERRFDAIIYNSPELFEEL